MCPNGLTYNSSSRSCEPIPNGQAPTPGGGSDAKNPQNDQVTTAVVTNGDTKYICGNGMIEGQEECDDRNTADGDGCSSNCMI